MTTTMIGHVRSLGTTGFRLGVTHLMSCLAITETALEQANIEDLRNLLKDLIEMREEQRTVQATIAELRSIEASEKR